MTLSTSEIESLRFHLGYGNVGVEALPYTPDGFWSVFEQIISPNLGTGATDTGTTSVTAGSVTTISVTTANNFDVSGELVVDVGPNAEIVQIQDRNIVGNTLTAYFAKAHTASYPVAAMCGKARLRMLLHDANVAWSAMTNGVVGSTAGIKSVDKEDVVFFEGFRVLGDRLSHYKSIVQAISSLVRVRSVWHWPSEKGRNVRLEAY